MPTQEDVLKALSTCQEPELGKDIVSLGMVRNLAVSGGRVSFDYVLTTPACPLKDRMQAEARQAVLKVPGVSEVDIRMTANVRRDVRLEGALPSGVRNVLAVGSGKGGVGKSTVAANIAVSLSIEGARVGLLDADVYGPNQPQMMGVTDFAPMAGPDNKIDPAEAYGVKIMSMGFLMEPDQPVIWRGPMLHGAVKQFLQDVRWGDLEYLVVDLPPGTGDVQLSLCQAVPLTGAVIVTTPQSVAVSDVRKAVAMFKKLNVPLLGLIENMSGFACPHCGEATDVFARGAARELAERQGIPVLGVVPLDPEVCTAGEGGRPVCVSRPESSPAAALREAARRVAAAVSVRAATAPQLKIESVP